jgi:hypothetical protein
MVTIMGAIVPTTGREVGDDRMDLGKGRKGTGLGLRSLWST